MSQCRRATGRRKKRRLPDRMSQCRRATQQTARQEMPPSQSAGLRPAKASRGLSNPLNNPPEPSIGRQPNARILSRRASHGLRVTRVVVSGTRRRTIWGLVEVHKNLKYASNYRGFFFFPCPFYGVLFRVLSHSNNQRRRRSMGMGT